MTYDEVAAQYQPAVDAAHSASTNAFERLQDLEQQLAANPEDMQALVGLQEAQSAYTKAQEAYTKTLTDKANAMTRAVSQTASEAEAAKLNAGAREAMAQRDVAVIQAREFAESAPDRKAIAAVELRQAEVTADLAQLDLDFARATTEDEKTRIRGEITSQQLANQQVEAALRSADVVNVPETQEWVVRARNDGSLYAERNPGFKKPEELLTPGERAVDTATADTAADLAKTNLKKAETELKEAELRVKEAERLARLAPSDEQAKRAVEQALIEQDLAITKLEQEIEKARDLAPIEVEQAQATLDATRAGTKVAEEGVREGQLGPLYGVREKMEELKGLIASGAIPEDKADQLFDDYVNVVLTGAPSIYDVRKDEETAGAVRTGQEITQRGQDVGLAGTRTSTYGAGFGNLYSNFTEMNQAITPGSDAGGRAFLAALNLFLKGMDRFETPARVDIPNAPSFVGDYTSGLAGADALLGLTEATEPAPPAVAETGTTAQPAPPAPPPGTPVAGTPAVSGPGGAVSSPVQPPTQQRAAAAAQRAGAEVMANMPAFAHGELPATPDDVRRLWGRAA